MIKLNGIEVDFDVVRIADYKRYHEALQAYQQTIHRLENHDVGSMMVILDALEGMV